MIEFFRKLLGSDFVPHGYCMRWSSEVVWLHVTSDAITALSYYLISIALIYLVRRRRDLAFNRMFALFGVFILACGTTHLMAVYTLWTPVYRLDGLVKALTAAASLPTAILLVRLLPKALALPGPDQWKALNEDLSRMVDERTAELQRTIAELRQTNERLRQSNADLEQFAYAASHDLQEPLRTVSVYAQLLDRTSAGQLSSESKQHLDTVIGGAMRMHALIEGLLQYSRAATSDPERRECANVAAAINSAMETLKAAIDAAGASVTFDSDAPDVSMSQTALSQVFQNLLGNALKYRSDQPLQVRIEVEEEPGQTVHIAVSDNGIGIHPKYHQQIFGVFKRLHGNRYPGTGMGLALCKRMIERNDGQIWVESALGGGSVFHIRLPQASHRPSLPREAIAT